ncbi:hypothetical protein A3SI_10504 [Nitritalea halalkaliphila LW7]|uniref:Lipoprotein n=1 Tax=Nitritalea halalkaliphila LW7 TaxID=1189621 RepID=I5C3N5_9BACT|nr:hypothetical protein [Nitritalea halalkaliphila]EIM76437.1 hypothetical protein A3SI_10504 [Nitritalea halalkaliphila LW7]
MNCKNALVSAGVGLLGMVACVTPPTNFPSVPEIEFNSLEFVETPGQDSLIVSVDFRDAEGDLGLNATEIQPPFQELTFRRDQGGNLITFRNRPANAPPFNPIDWRINPIVNNQEVRDTIWVEPNPNHNNIFVRFFIKRNGVFQEFRWEDPPFFTSFNGRFPRILAGNNTQAVEGTIAYAMVSSGWNNIFRNDTIRVEVRIQDRQLNSSAWVSSPEVTLQGIRRR